MPLEIGPIPSPPENRFLDADKRFFGDTLVTGRKCEMLVKYRNKPAAGIKVLVHSMGSPWKQELITDGEGKINLVPMDDSANPKAGSPKYLLVASFCDPSTKTTHVSTLLMNVSVLRRDASPSKMMGFILWSVGGGVGLVLIVIGMLRRRMWRMRRRLAIFDNYTIKEDL